MKNNKQRLQRMTKNSKNIKYENTKTKEKDQGEVLDMKSNVYNIKPKATMATL